MSAPRVGLCLLTFNELEGCRRDVPRFYGETHFKALAGGTHLLKYLAREVLGTNPGQQA